MVEVIDLLSSDNEPEDDWFDARENPEQVGEVNGNASTLDKAELTIDQIVPKILEMVPDVALDHLESLVGNFLETGDPTRCVESIIHSLFDSPSYPKSEPPKGRKRKFENNDSSEVRKSKVSRSEIDYASKERTRKGGPEYAVLALNQLCTDFPFIPVSYVRSTLRKNNQLYAPTHLQLLLDQAASHPPYKSKSYKTKVPGKCTAKDPEYIAEREWLEGHLLQHAKATNQEIAVEEDGIEDAGDGIDCGCCFSSYSFGRMIQCAEGHLFCRTCVTQYAETLLGGQNYVIVCMDQSNCKEPFPEVELERVLPPKLLDLYYRVRQRKEIAAAGLEGLEECPFCDFKYVIENPEERLFRCQNEDCQAVTCRNCKKPDHLPKSCKEMDDDTRLSGRHAVEEALSNALMRSCPKCKQKNIIKDYGCNKMTCPECHTLFCYIWENSKNRDPRSSALFMTIEEAARRAAIEFRADNPDIGEKDLAVEIPKVVAVNRPGAQLLQRVAVPGAGPDRIHQHHVYPFNFGIAYPAPIPQHFQFGPGGALNLPVQYLNHPHDPNQLQDPHHFQQIQQLQQQQAQYRQLHQQANQEARQHARARHAVQRYQDALQLERARQDHDQALQQAHARRAQRFQLLQAEQQEEEVQLLQALRQAEVQNLAPGVTPRRRQH